MTEFIVRLTDEQVETCRRVGQGDLPNDISGFIHQLFDINRDIRNQIIDAIKLYDELVAAAQEASDV